MVQSQFSLSWETYKSSICNGFSALQQNGEFVDMTLAADGHFVKVHQILMALVSPYLKELINSAPCQHPVIFLNNVSFKTLCCLLEYVYTGEVSVPAESLVLFVDTAKALHIRGLEDLDNSSAETAYKVAEDETAQVRDSSLSVCHKTGIKRLAVPSEIGSGEIGLPAAAKKIMLKHQKSTKILDKPQKSSNTISREDDSYTEMMDSTDMQNFSDDDYALSSKETQDSRQAVTNASATNLQYTVSIRGSLQVILNRYIYNVHSSAANGVRRWRCVDYRNHRCKAFITTKENIVLNRANLHNHSFHDKKILQKIEKKAVFSALKDVEGYKESTLAAEKEAESSMEQEGCYVLDLPHLEVDSDDKDSKNWNTNNSDSQ